MKIYILTVLITVIFLPRTTYSQSLDSLPIDFDYANYTIVIADTSSNYYVLDKLMKEINRKQGIKIDTMGRYYDDNKKIICLRRMIKMRCMPDNTSPEDILE